MALLLLVKYSNSTLCELNNEHDFWLNHHTSSNYIELDGPSIYIWKKCQITRNWNSSRIGLWGSSINYPKAACQLMFFGRYRIGDWALCIWMHMQCLKKVALSTTKKTTFGRYDFGRTLSYTRMATWWHLQVPWNGCGYGPKMVVTNSPNAVSLKYWLPKPKTSIEKNKMKKQGSY